jgi:tetratricopeptide (TPR) repeat protein
LQEIKDHGLFAPHHALRAALALDTERVRALSEDEALYRLGDIADIAHYAFDRAFFERDKKRAPDEHLARSIEYGKRAVAGNPLDVEAHFYLGRAYELAGQLPEAIAALLGGYELNPSDARVNGHFARVLIKSNELEAGVQLIGRLYSASHSDEYRAKLKKLEEAVLSGDVDEDDLKGVLE